VSCRVSGRNTNTWAAAGIAPQTSETIPVGRVTGARLALECRVLATVDLDPGLVLDPSSHALYRRGDWHRAFLGEVLAARIAVQPASPRSSSSFLREAVSTSAWSEPP